MTERISHRIDLGKVVSSQEEGKQMKLNFEIDTEYGTQKTRVVLPYLGTGMKFLQRGFISADPYDKINSPHYLLGKLIDYIDREDELFFLYEMQMFEDQHPRATLYASKIKHLDVKKSDISELEIFSNKVRAHKVIADLKDRNDSNVQRLLHVFSKYEEHGKYRAITSWE